MLIGGLIDLNVVLMDVIDFGYFVIMGQLEEIMIQCVGFKYDGVGCKVYLGFLQFVFFMLMNVDMYGKVFMDQIICVMKGEVFDYDKYNCFYDEYFVVMDMFVEFYLFIVDCIFKKGEIVVNDFIVVGCKVDIGVIMIVVVKIVEGFKDDILVFG